MDKEKLLNNFTKCKISCAGKHGRLYSFLKDPRKKIALKIAKLGYLKECSTKLFWGKKISLPTDDRENNSLLTCGKLQKTEDNLTEYIINNLGKDDVFFDIGANYGFYTLLASELTDPSKVHTFEPNEKVFNYLKRNCHPSNKLNNVAVGKEEGTGRLFMNKGGSGKFTMVQDVMKETDGWQETGITTLDEYTTSNDYAPDLIKIDVEGAEIDVLKGSVKTLEQTTPKVIMEVWSGSKGVEFSMEPVHMLLELGFRSHRINEDGQLEPFEIDPIKLTEDHENFVFIKTKK